jgi:type 1 fimbriae regulatory protein FimB/type 1 fimbriae regulatory protein FimE
MPNTKNGTVPKPTPHLQVVGEQAKPPARRRNSEVRSREYLTPAEVETLRKTARQRGRYGHRDATMILLTYRHGLRVSELVSLRWDQVDLAQGRLHVNRAKNWLSSVHPLGGEEIRALRRSSANRARAIMCSSPSRADR